jgi:putative transposase
MRKEHLTLTESDHSYLTTLTTSGQLKARKYKRAMTLMLLHDGHSMSEVSKLLQYSYPSIVNLKKNYLADGLLCLEEKPRPGRPPEFAGADRAKITALACSDTPAGHARWSLRLLADRAVELELVEAISHTQVGHILKKTNLNRI